MPSTANRDILPNSETPVKRGEGDLLALRADDCGDLGFAARSVGISLGPGLVDAGSA